MDSAQLGMNAAQECVVVKAPLNRVCEQWSCFEGLPKFIPPLRGVRKIDDTHFSYVWHPNGEEKQGIFQIVLQIPGRRIAWRTFDPSNLSLRFEEYLGNFKRLVERAEGKV